MSKELRRQVGRLLRQGPRVLPIVQAGDPVLRRVAEPYDGQLSDELFAELVEAMRLTMHDAPGVGLAAPQIGLGLALAVAEDEGSAGDDGEDDDPRERTALPFRVLVNPRYEVVGEQRVPFFEGCLSVDGYQAVVARPHRVRLHWADAAGRAQVEELSGWPARIVQHETDHLNGVLYLDHADLRTLSSNENLAAADDED
ncbi:MAG: Peptide deformylase [uncultured Quadrisphaera sp.]|uniref:Peptide deformylase n=1 Tax=uncultured Quadrisphaera sp. TaxID=904978 RepID=A0A6J4NNP3_9ACTN|nr:MAG: Peptide deformylase [uncultured Quadrisphaera sp.]